MDLPRPLTPFFTAGCDHVQHFFSSFELLGYGARRRGRSISHQREGLKHKSNVMECRQHHDQKFELEHKNANERLIPTTLRLKFRDMLYHAAQKVKLSCCCTGQHDEKKPGSFYFLGVVLSSRAKT